MGADVDDFSWHHHRRRVRHIRRELTLDVLVVLGIVAIVPILILVLWRL